MFIEWMHIENYRNLSDLELHFHKDMNYFVGENSVGKSNFLSLLETIMNAKGFAESDFTSVNKPIRVQARLSFTEIAPAFEGLLDEGNTITIQIEQLVEEVFPRVYKITNKSMKPMLLSMLRHALYLYHKDTAEGELYTIPSTVYSELGNQLEQCLPTFGISIQADIAQRNIRGLKGNLDPKCILNIRHLIEILGTSNHTALADKYSVHNVRLIMAVALKILAQIYMKVNSASTPLESLVVYDESGRRLLPLFISIDEPELHLSPYLQRALLNYYRQVVTNEIPEFIRLLKTLFNIDGLLGQVFIVTHSTDSLVDDYRYIIRLYKDEQAVVQAACGVNFKFPQEVEKHLIMHFPEAKEALYARCIILVEGETEYGSFSGFASKLHIDFDYFGICLMNARGESSISKLHKLFKRFGIPTVALYDRDMLSKHSKAHPNVFYTDEICFEMDVVAHMIHHGHRSALDAMISDMTDQGRGMVTKDMVRRGVAKLGLQRQQIVPRRLKNIKAKDIETLLIYYFSWFYSNKGVIVGRRISHHTLPHMIPPAFVKVIQRAKELAITMQI
ncbi:ATP-dependent nuclease [Veillonella agrestimuris]|uniref:ATP-dependent nuclease n=1 Tax=Veillonella agrestimuris TaxID=2941340 RepID=UPI00203CDF70|nr:AAA family ATPase [Veillonella agrestimuris]